MAADSLRDELMTLPGVAEAEVDAEGGAPSGVRVKLLPDADPQRVGSEVQRVLASHGMRSRVAPDDESIAPVVSLPFAPAAVPPRPEAPPPTPEAIAPPRPASEPPRVEPVVVAAPMEVVQTAARRPVERAADVPGREQASTPRAAEPAPVAPERPAPGAAGTGRGLTLASLAYEESPEGVIVTAVADDGQRFSRRAAAPSDEAVSSAVVAAVGALAEGRPQRLLWVSAAVVDGTEVVTVVIEKADGSRVAGAAIVRAAKAYAVARAAFVALRG